MVSGHGGTTGMANNSQLVKFFAQVGQLFVIINCFKTDNWFIVVLPCPGTLFDPFRDLLLLMCGGIKENPGPGDETMTEMFKLIKETNERSIRIEENQTNMSQSITELKDAQESIFNSIADINKRLQALETQSAAYDSWKINTDETRQVLQRMEKENTTLKARLDDAADRSRRDNLVFYGITDSKSETWQDSEKKIIAFAAKKLQFDIPTGTIARAHRIGRFAPGRNRPIIVMFSANKIKELVFAKRSSLDDSDVHISLDFCPATRLARKKLVEYGNSLKASFKLKHNKLIIGNQYYAYDPNDDAIHLKSGETDSRNVDTSCPGATRSGRIFSANK
ncbi:hypothetical protein HPB48_016515 [Haemaphysalis longicornis]|uniref:Uncharacterized protein n=1 Tax=Haemaphysalis longicornis TaxID=44386 RepID=A0A9J6H5V4_HAELO|nr:hypothetical protein HPB48_016515 [Haemaphysalis longicornis]